MWYEAYDHNYRSDGDGYLCYSRSSDGVKWEKPNMGLVEYGGNTNNNRAGRCRECREVPRHHLHPR